MNMKKVTAIAAAVIMAAGICTGVPTGTETASPLAVTAEAASSDFVIKTDDDGDKYIAGYKGKGGDVVIPDGIVWIDEKAFFGNDKITSVTIPKSCYNIISSYAFAECVNLKKVMIEGDIGINVGAFQYCINLESFTVKGSIHDGIGAGAFDCCEKLKTVKIGGNEYDFVICQNAFDRCYSLTSISIPSKCTKIYGAAFGSCFNLTKLTIPAKTKIITENGQRYHFGYAKLTGMDAFVADGKTSGYVNHLISKDEAEKNGTPYALYEDSNVLAYGDREKVTPKQLTLTVTKGSPAEKWAKANGVKYVYAGSSSTGTNTSTNNSSKLAAPTNIKGSVSENKIVLTWNKVSGAKAYRVYMYNAKTGKYVKYKDVGSEKCTVTGLDGDTKYSFKVYALAVENGKYVPQKPSKAVAFRTKEYNTDIITL